MAGISKNPKISDQDTAIAKIYDTLVADLNQGQAATRGIFAQGGQAMGSAYQGAADQLRGTQTGITDRLTSSLSGLGLQEALPSVLNPMNEQFAFDQGAIAKERGTNLGALSKQGTEYQAIGQLGIGNAQKEKAQTRVSAMEKLQALLADLEAERIRANAEIEQQRLENQLRLAQAKADSAARSGGGGGGDIDPLDALRAQKLGLEVEGLERKLTGEGQPVEYYGGQRGLDQFLNNPSAYWAKSADPLTRLRVQSLLDQTGRRLGSSLSQFTSGNKQYSKKGLTDLDIARIGVSNTKERQINKDALRMAMELYYGKGSKL